MSTSFTIRHYARKHRSWRHPLYHGNVCEELYHQIAELKVIRHHYALLLKTNKSSYNRNMFDALCVKIKDLRDQYHVAYRESDPHRKPS